MEKEVGKITHWYDKIGVAVIDLKGALKMGDRVKIKKGEDEFEETISSMQVDHKDIEEAKKGKEIGIEIDQKVRDGDEVFIVT